MGVTKPRSTARIGSSPASPVMEETSQAWPSSQMVKADTTLNLADTGAAGRLASLSHWIQAKPGAGVSGDPGRTRS